MCWMVIDIPCNVATSAELSEAERVMRAAAHDYVAMLRTVQPETARAELLQTGPQIGIREGHHCQTDELVTEEDLIAGRQRSDGIARAAWPMEDYAQLGKAQYRYIGGPGYAHVPLGALRASGVNNLLLAGRNIGSDRRAYASVRVMGTALATGYAAGIAAADPDASTETIVDRIQALGGLV